MRYSHIWKKGECLYFINSLRKVLGLQPIFETAREQQKPLEYWMLGAHDNGNRQVRSRPTGMS